MEKKKFRDIYDYMNHTAMNFDYDVKKLCDKYQIEFNHSGGGCIHLGMSLDEDNEKYFFINPYNDDVDYTFDDFKEDTYCIFGLYDSENDDEHHHFYATFKEGVEFLNYLRGVNNG
jgi:hypothetical protein